MAEPIAFVRLIEAIERAGYRVTDRKESTARAQCPAHQGTKPSLSIFADDTRVSAVCHSRGCDLKDVLEAVGLTIAARYNQPGTSYRYDDGRTVHRTPDKQFSQSGNTKGTPTLYRATKVAQAVAEGVRVLLVEGEADVHAAEAIGAVATTAPQGARNFAKTDLSPLTGAHVTAVIDRDDQGDVWARQVAALVGPVAKSLRFVHAAHGKDLSDHLAAGHTLGDLVDITHENAENAGAAEGASCTLADTHATFRNWMGDDYDTDALNVALIVAAVERLDGDPLWALIIGGSGAAKTETVQPLVGAGALVTSTISSPGALLSATSRKERSQDATGGLLRKLGGNGVLVIKDVTSILSMNRDMRAETLAALREVYDGQWARNVGTDGGRTLEWRGRLGVVGAVTTAWDKAHSVIASMGDRFVLLRLDSTTGRQKAGRRAIGNTGDEVAMRAELAVAVGGVLARMDLSGTQVTESEIDALLAAADLVTLARTGVEYDYKGDVIDAHAPEMPTRFAKQLTQVVRGGVALGMERADAVRLAIRCARDSMPPMRLAIVDDVAAHPGSTPSDTRKRIDKPRSTVDREMQALHMLGVLTCDEEEATYGGKPVTRWRYKLAEGIDPGAIRTDSFTRFVSNPTQGHREESLPGACLPTDISGEASRRGGHAPVPGTSREPVGTSQAFDLFGSNRTSPEAPLRGRRWTRDDLLRPGSTTCRHCGNDLVAQRGTSNHCRDLHDVQAAGIEVGS